LLIYFYNPEKNKIAGIILLRGFAEDWGGNRLS
jgi:hypothetical protein